MPPFAKGKSGNPNGRPRLPQEFKDLREVAKVYTKDALKTLVSILEDEDCDPRARVQACNSILDRGYGKPRQEIEVESKNLPAAIQIITPLTVVGNG